jgi:hypothetical protein
MPTITKHGEAFYTLDRLHCTGHRDKDGRILSATGTVAFAFRRPGDPEGTNLDPVDVLNVLADHLAGHPAAASIAEAAELLDESAADAVAKPRRKKAEKWSTQLEGATV